MTEWNLYDELVPDLGRLLEAQRCSDSVEVTDASASIVVRTVEGRIVVELDDSWRAHHRPERLAAEIARLWGRLVEQRSRAWMEGLESGKSIETARSAPTLPSDFDLSAVDPERAMERMTQQLDQLAADVGRVAREAPRLGEARLEGRSVQGEVEATLDVGGDLVALRIAGALVDRGTGHEIAEQVNNAIAAAQRAVTADLMGDPDVAWKYEEDAAAITGALLRGTL